MGERRPGARFRLSKAVRAVKLEEHPGSSLRSPTRTLVEIPANSIVELEGATAPSRLRNMRWEGEVYAVFYEDVEDGGPIANAADDTAGG